MKIPKKLIDFYKNPRQNGIFYSMFMDGSFSALFNKLGINSTDDAHMVDFEYLFNHSGLKSLSAMLERIIMGYIMDSDEDNVQDSKGFKVTWDYIIQQVDQDIITYSIKIKYLDKWNNLADTLSMDYDALSPYQMQIEDDTGDTLESTNEDSTSTNEESTENNSQSMQGSDDASRYGFNSEDAVPTDADKTSSTQESENNYSNVVKRDSNVKYNRLNNISRKIIRKGNIGNHSAMELIEQQREMLRYQIFDTIYRDLDDVLTRSKYN